jgi:phenylpropionate dioxygenase-like ring-hydroxylating dioxygenase large terminal subunit
VDTSDQRCGDPTVLDLWHPLVAVSELSDGIVDKTLLLGFELRYGTDRDGRLFATRADDPETALPVVDRHGYLWTSLGEPPDDVFAIPETSEPDRRTLNAASIKVATSAPRAIENFLDMGHFPYVHTDYLGVEPHTEVAEYRVEIENEELWARDCFFYQPMAAASAVGGQLSEYTYRVPHPYCVMLYKSSPTDPTRSDVIGLFVQAMTQDTIRAHNFLSVIDETSSDTVLRRFQQIIFSQDKPILENQFPTRLPLDPRIETPIRADRSAIVYRRWLTELGLTYCVIPAA